MTLQIQQKIILGLCLSLLGGVSSAAIQGMSFEHKDWELACDNTGTCRAAGYQTDDNYEHPVSVLLTRNAGANTPVVAEVQFGENEENQKSSAKYELKIDGKSYGWVKNSTQSNLNPHQLNALLATAQRDAVVEFIAGKQRYTLSGQGMSAVLLKMDEFQKRIGTPSALIKKGQNSHQNVLKAEVKPVLVAKDLIQGRVIKLLPKSEQAQKIIAVLKKTTHRDDCPVLFGESDYFESDRMVITPITPTLSAISHPCWSGAYNFGQGVWVMDKKLNEVKQLVSTSVSDEADNQLFENHKGRGVGDCWSQAEWTWDGQHYIKTFVASTGQCKGFAGGAWQLPTVVTEVKGLKQ
ncbi:hypothetical protein A7P53_12990 [Acinetobacter defluvii]|uniref:DUF1176 domain-containing protein n=1 Tax=Acinetobacter defluvii TaxID=1871111 RepID=UPI0014908888|nr:DUF1176 domain-containing protein [Acinetobacter defluvii]NNP73467.1 hypothetical protein [Acinetobacter defluvii]